MSRRHQHGCCWQTDTDGRWKKTITYKMVRTRVEHYRWVKDKKRRAK